MYTTLQASRAMLYSVARSVDNGNLSNTVFYYNLFLYRIAQL